MKLQIKTKREEDGLLIDLKNVYLTNDEGVQINLDFYLKELLKRLKRLEEKMRQIKNLKTNEIFNVS